MNAVMPTCPDTQRYVEGKISFDDFQTEDPALARTLDRARIVARTDRPVLLTGESGCGKNFLARAIHHASSRADKPFVQLNAAALPTDLAYSELFGHAAHAFTGAAADHAGAFAAAHGGTLFLDEIGDLPLPLQPLLLRAVAERTYTPLGGRDRHADVRLLFATHQDLPQLVREKAFREDLWFRIQEFVLHVPPLRSRPADLPVLLFRFLAAAGRPDLARQEAFHPDAWRLLAAHPWPGNLRELRTAARRLAVYVRGPVVQASDVELESASTAASAGACASAEHGEEILPLQEVVRQHVRRALRLSRNHAATAASRLGVCENTVYKYARADR